MTASAPNPGEAGSPELIDAGTIRFQGDRNLSSALDQSSKSIVGVVLAGGRGRRMAGATGESDKALIDLCGNPLLGHVITRLEAQTGRIVINANGDPVRLAFTRHPVISDTIPDYAGPLAGLLAGIEWTHDNCSSATHVVTVPTDTPFIPHDLVEHLARAAGHGSAIAVSGGREHYAVGLWPLSIAASLRELLSQSGNHSARSFADRCKATRVAFEPAIINGRAIDPFFNINTPADLIDAKAVLCP